LRALRFDDPCSQATFVDYLAAVELLLGRRASLLEALEQAIPASSHQPVIARLRCFRWIDTLSAAGLAAEVGDFGRFPKPSLLSPPYQCSGSEVRQRMAVFCLCGEVG
jgi:transposase